MTIFQKIMTYTQINQRQYEHMKELSTALKNEKGSIIVVALMILSVLTILGMSATSNSIYESQIVRNEHLYYSDFYIADSGWKEAAMWLENAAGPPATVNPGADNIVKNFGFGTAASDPAPSDLNALTPDNSALTLFSWTPVNPISNAAPYRMSWRLGAR